MTLEENDLSVNKIVKITQILKHLKITNRKFKKICNFTIKLLNKSKNGKKRILNQYQQFETYSIHFNEQINDIPINVSYVFYRLFFVKFSSILILILILQQTIKSLLQYSFTLLINESLNVCNDYPNVIKKKQNPIIFYTYGIVIFIILKMIFLKMRLQTKTILKKKQKMFLWKQWYITFLDYVKKILSTAPNKTSAASEEYHPKDIFDDKDSKNLIFQKILDHL